jgi:hypothetical protein
MRRVAAPSPAESSSTRGACSKSGLVRTIRYTPAVTIVAAWIRALTGVGPSMASGSHVCSGSCADFATAPPSRPSATRLAAQPPREPAWGKTTSKFSEPVRWIRRKSARAIVASPTAFMMKAFFAAAIALGRSCQKPISRYDERPTSPQPARSINRFPPWTSSSIEKTNSAM